MPGVKCLTSSMVTLVQGLSHTNLMIVLLSSHVLGTTNSKYNMCIDYKIVNMSAFCTSEVDAWNSKALFHLMEKSSGQFQTVCVSYAY